MPTLDDGPKARPAVNAPLLAQIVAGRRDPRLRRASWPEAPRRALCRTFSLGRCKAPLRALWPLSAFRLS